MPRPFTTLTALLAALALLLALSPAAFSQAADEQYADPFGDVPEEPSNAPAPQPDQSTEQPSSPSSGGDGDAAGGLPETATDTQDTMPDATTSDDSASTSTGEELARTGLPAGLLACLGLAMLFTGALLRLALARPPRSTTRPPPLMMTFTAAAFLSPRPGPGGWLNARSRDSARAR